MLQNFISTRNVLMVKYWIVGQVHVDTMKLILNIMSVIIQTLHFLSFGSLFLVFLLVLTYKYHQFYVIFFGQILYNISTEVSLQCIEKN